MMYRSSVFKALSAMLIVAILLQGLPVAAPRLLMRRASAAPIRQDEPDTPSTNSLLQWPPDQEEASTDPPPQQRTGEASANSLFLYLPVVQGGKSASAPNFVINSPTAKKLSGTVFFSIQPLNASQIVSVTFAVNTSSVTDNTPNNGFQVAINVKSFPSGAYTLQATAFGPGGQSTRTLDVEFIQNPPTSAAVDVDGAVVGSEIGSTVAIPPGGAAPGTTVAVTERTQAQVTQEMGIQWDRLGVTFLGAQKLTVSAPFTTAFGVSSAGFGNRVQPNQAVVTYMLLPDADGDGVGELAVINGAGVASNGDVISNPVDRVTVAPPASPISGPPGTLFRLTGAGFNAAAYLGSVGVWTSKVNGETLRVPALVELSEVNLDAQVLAMLIPPLPAGGATLTLFNESNGSSAGPFDVTIGAPPTVQNAAGIVDQFLLDSANYFKAIPSDDTAAKETLTLKADHLLTVRKILADTVAAGLTGPQQEALNRAAQVIAGSSIYQTGDQPGYKPGTSDQDMAAFVFGFSTTLNALFEPFATGVSASSPDAPQLFPAVVAVILLGGVIAALEATRLAKKLAQLRKCLAAQRQAVATNRMTGMGSAPPRGGPVCGTVNGLGGGLNVSGARQAAADEKPILVRVYSRSGAQLSPFTGVVDASGYFFVPLVPQNQPYVIVALDPDTGYSRKYSGIGPIQTDSGYFHFDLTQDPFTSGVIRWDGAGDGSSWNDPLNWDRGVVPGPNHHVVIDVPGEITVTHRFNESHIKSLASQEKLVVASGELWIGQSTQISKELSLLGGTIGVTSTLTTSGNFFWGDGTITGPGKTISEGDLILGGYQPTLDAHTFENKGTARWSTPDAYNYFYLTNGATFDNLPGASFIDQRSAADATAQIYSDGSAVQFKNRGSFIKSGNNHLDLMLPFHNSGAINVQAGRLNLADGTSAGSFNTAAGGVLGLTGNHNFTSGATFTGNGVVEIPSGVNSFTSNYTLPRLQITAGELTGDGTVTVSQVLTWTGGTMSGAGKTVVTGATMIDNSVTLQKRTLENRGTLRWLNGYIYLSEDALLHNTASGTFRDEQTGGWAITYAANPDNSRFQNDGVYIKSGNATTTINHPFHNNGTTIDVQAGTLHLVDGILNNASTLKGEFGSSSLTIPSGSGTTFSGPMTWSGIITGTGTLTTTGVITWTGGTMQGAGKTVVTGEMRVDNSVTLLKRTLENRGTLRWLNGYIYLSEDALLRNTASGTFRDEQTGGWAITYAANPDNSRFQNDGVYIKSGNATTTINHPFHNNGTIIDVQAGTLHLVDGILNNASTLKGEFGSSSLTIPSGSGTTFSGPMTWSGIITGTGTLTTTGVITWTGGTMQGAGKTVVTGEMRVDNSVTLLKRTLENRGTLRWLNGYIYLSEDALLRNTASGTFRDEQTGGWGVIYASNPDNSRFQNDGVYIKSGDAYSYINPPFPSDGDVTINVGTLSLGDGHNGGVMEIAGGAVADINGTFENKAGGVIQGSGTLDVSGAAFTNNGTIAPTVMVIN